MTRLKTNIIANFMGQAAGTLLQLAITPVYIRYLGIEAYGLIGFLITLQALAQVLDFGLSPTVNRELARFSALPDASNKARDFIRTLELGYWVLGIGIGLGIYLIAPFLSVHWLQRSTMPSQVVRQAIEIMAVLIAAQWPLTFYQGGIVGLQRHTALNVVKVSMAALAAGGGYIVVSQVSPTITALLWWLCAAGIAHVALTTAVLWRYLPQSNRPPRVRRDAVSHIGTFAGGMTVITVTSLVLTQLDRIVLSRILPLEQFGYYVLAGLVSTGLTFLVRPLFTSIFPRFSALIATGDRAAVERLYRRAWGLGLALIVPCSLVVVLFPTQLLLLWTGQPVVAQSAGPIAAVLIVGTALNCLMTVPYSLQVACGWTSLSVKLNVILTAVAVPAIILSARRYGAIGAASVWPLLMGCYVSVALPVIHRKLLPDFGRRWFFADVAMPTGAAILAAVVCRAAMPATGELPVLILSIAVPLVAAELALLWTNASLRREWLPFVLKAVEKQRLLKRVTTWL